MNNSASPTDNSFQLNARLINAASESEVNAFAALRIESLRMAPRFVDGSIETEGSKGFEYWQELCRPSENRSSFGLFANEADLVGLAYCKLADVTKWGGDKDRKTAELGGTYIVDKYRSREAINVLSRAIRTWLRENNYDDAISYIYPNNLRSIAACTKRGAIRIHEANTPYADGSVDRAHLYRFDLRATDPFF